MNIQIQIQVCRACLVSSENTKLVEYSQGSDILKNYCELINSELTTGLPRTFCDKCVTKIKLLSSFKKSSTNSETYLKSFVVKISQEFAKSLPSNSLLNKNESDKEDPDIEQLLQEADDENKDASIESTATKEKTISKSSSLLKPKIEKFQENKTQPSVAKRNEKPRSQQVKIEAVDWNDKDSNTKEYIEMESSAMYSEDEDDQLDNDENLFGEETYDIMEIENESTDNIYADESGGKQAMTDGDEEFILVNFKSSNDDLSEKDQQFVVEELIDEEFQVGRTGSPRKKHVNRMPREIIEKYAQSTDNNQHMCKKCVKVFSTRTNLIRHIQSHDGYKAYVCPICKKGFTQSGSLKQHMYIHSGERPYKCQYCDRAFTQGKTLKFHLRRHTEEKPFLCSECTASFRQRDGLKRHLKSRHGIELKYERTNQINDRNIGFIDTAGENLKSTEQIETFSDEKKENL